MHYVSPRRFSSLYKEVMSRGMLVPSERGNTREILNASFTVKNPRDRLITEAWRKINFPFAIAEWIAIMAGDNSLALLQQFIKGYGKYSSDGKFVDGSYAERITPPLLDNPTQIEAVLDMLHKNPFSRRAVISIYEREDLTMGKGGLSTPCTLTYQFLVRKGKLEMITNMRSNDLFFGLGHDLIVNTMLQEHIARQLDLDLGAYHHNAASLHVYDDFWHEDAKIGYRWPILMDPMPKFEGTELNDFYYVYREQSSSSYFDDARVLAPYFRNLAMAGYAFTQRSLDGEVSRKAYKAITDYAIRRVLRPWLPFIEKEIK